MDKYIEKGYQVEIGGYNPHSRKYFKGKISGLDHSSAKFLVELCKNFDVDKIWDNYELKTLYLNTLEKYHSKFFEDAYLNMKHDVSFGQLITRYISDDYFHAYFSDCYLIKVENIKVFYLPEQVIFQNKTSEFIEERIYE